MDRRTALPIYPDPPREYTQRWGSDLVRALDQLNAILRNPGEGRATRITLTDLPTSDQGLEPGALFNWRNQVYITSLDRAFVGGFAATSGLGSVTVTT